MSDTRPERILIVDDDVAIARMLQQLLESVGYRIHTETSGQAALTYAMEEPPALVILDLRLPDLNGYDVCRRLRHLYSGWTLPVIMLTGMDRPVDQLRGFAHGADAYLTKPCDPSELLKTVGLLLGEAEFDWRGLGTL